MPHSLQKTLRLSKRMAELGLCSRREADSYIGQGWVKVNGQTAVIGQKVTSADRIDLNRQAHEKQAQRVTILLNKPMGWVSAQAEKGYPSAAGLITPENRWEGDNSRIQFDEKHKFGLAPAGRLDIDSTGLLVLTQDGRIAKQLIGENNNSEKEYLVRIRGTLSEEGLKLLNHGLSLDGEKLKPAKVEWQNEDQLRFILKQGKKRQIRRMCELVGLRVTGLKRIRMGRVKLGRLPPGKWRYLRHDETF
ncbi:pseudouridine synthase [Neisseria musculi]|uniref:Dual-specificity RNA pseudouridine synthase RluF n=1 Tax=Neisseria musculi TaxID=1815583 RepID=A0A7H1M8V4_9NEIS|nr:pseudouridine synthase [Neisseria musculi]QNT58069.1 pseudouridine synthase family protein [Neisseria musculi]